MLGCVLDMLDTGASMLDVLGWATGVPQNPMRGQHPMFASPCRPPPKVGAPPKFWGGVGDGGWKPRGGGLHGGTPFGPAWLTLSIHFLTRPGHGASKNLDCPHTGQAPIFAIWMAARCSSVAGFDSPPLGPARPLSISGN